MKEANEKPQDLRSRTVEYAYRVIRLYMALPKNTVAEVIGKQLLRSGTSAGAHYREACRAKSDADFISKNEGALQELEETGYWLELLVRSQIIPIARLKFLMKENDELIAIIVTIVKKVKDRRRGK